MNPLNVVKGVHNETDSFARNPIRPVICLYRH